MSSATARSSYFQPMIAGRTVGWIIGQVIGRIIWPVYRCDKRLNDCKQDL